MGLFRFPRERDRSRLRSMGESKVHLNGQIMPISEATLSIADVGFLHGASAFTTMLAHNGVVFRLDRHIARLLDTVRLLGLRSDANADSLAEATNELLPANSLSRARVRITLSPGELSGDQTTTLITADPLPEYAPEWYEKGISVVIAAFKQMTGSPVYGHKTGCYLPRVLARQEAAAKGCDEALWFTPDNRLAEACFCNVFLVLGGEVYTPPRDTPVLPGVAREAVLELCGGLGIVWHDDRALTIRETLGATEMFLTSSCTGVRPVVRVERHAVGSEKPGPITRKIMASYRALLDQECAG